MHIIKYVFANFIFSNILSFLKYFGVFLALCAYSYEISGSQDAQTIRMGVFQQVEDVYQNGMSVYKNDEGEYLFYSTTYDTPGAWLVGPDYENDIGGIYAVSQTKCPDQNELSWLYWYDGQWNNGDIKVEPKSKLS